MLCFSSQCDELCKVELPATVKERVTVHHGNSAGSQEYVREKDDGAKLDYSRRALSEDSRFDRAVALDSDLQDAIERARDQTPKETMEKRECTMRAICEDGPRHKNKRVAAQNCLFGIFDVH